MARLENMVMKECILSMLSSQILLSLEKEIYQLSILHFLAGDHNNLEEAASTSDNFKSSASPEWQTQSIITSDQAAQNNEKMKEEEEYDIDHDHLLLPWACCIPIVLDNFEAKQACYDHYSFPLLACFLQTFFITIVLYLATFALISSFNIIEILPIERNN